MKTPRSQTQFPGICQFAKLAGVSREHAYRVLTGERSSPVVESQWEQFKRGKLKPGLKAQAQLIRKAAPDLFLACMSLLPCASGYKDDDENRAIITQAKAAITKAKGQS